MRGMQTTNHEIEAKFTLLDAARVVHWSTTPSLTTAFPLRTPITVTHLDTYLDAVDYRLLRRGYALRLRQTTQGDWVTVKSLSLDLESSIHNRLELEGPTAIDGDPWQMTSWPESIRQFVGALLGADVELRPLCTLQQTRHKRDVLSDPANAQPIAQLSIDQVVVYGPEFEQTNADERLTPNQAEPNSDGRKAAKPITTFYEIELELTPGQDQALLTRLVRTLAKDRTLRVNTNSKLERALELISTHAFDGENYGPALQPTMPIAEACRSLWRQQLTQLLLKEAGVRYSHHNTYVHEMCVAIQRAHVAAQLFGQYFRTKRIRRFAKVLKQMGQRLGAIHDLDVTLNRLGKLENDSHTDIAADLASLAAHWRAERQQAHQALLAWLDSKAYAHFIEKFAHFCQTPGKGAKKFTTDPGKAPVAYQVRHVMPSLLIDQFKRVRCFETLLETAEPIPEATLHLLRIECKSLRYSLEFMRPLPGFHGESLIKALKKLQDKLGQLNDVAVGHTLLKRLPATIDESVIEQYAKIQAAQIEPLRARLPVDLADFLALSNRRKLTQVIAHL